MLGDNDYLQKKAGQLGLGRAEALAAIQALLDSWYPGQVRALSLNDAVLRLVTPNASVAQDLRLRQMEIVGKLFNDQPVKRLQISVGQTG